MDEFGELLVVFELQEAQVPMLMFDQGGSFDL
jgi:hypothetical protein